MSQDACAARREVRRLRGACAALAVALVATLGVGAKRSEVRQADRVELVDAQGVVRGVMGTTDGHPWLRLGHDGSAGATVTTNGPLVSLALWTDSPRHPRVHVQTAPDGSQVALLDRAGSARALVTLAGDGDLIAISRDPAP